MSNRKLIILGAVAALMVLWAVIQARITHTWPTTQPVPSHLIQGLNTANIAAIILNSDDDSFTLSRQGRTFVVTEKDNYPAMTGEINNLITSCLDISTTELVTEDSANHNDLEVTEAKARSVVKFLDKAGRPITGIIIGKRTDDGRGSYVRLLSSNDVYLATDVPWLRSSPMDYIDKELLKVDAGKIVRVTVTGPQSGYTLIPADPNSDDVVLENMPPGKKPKPSDCKQVFSALTNLQLQDVKKQSKETADLSFDHTYVCRLEDSTVYTLNIAKNQDKTYAKCSAEFLDKSKVKVTRTESEQELKNKEAKLLAADDAGAFTEKHKAWVYEIPDWRANYLTKKLSDLVEEPQEQNKTAPDK